MYRRRFSTGLRALQSSTRATHIILHQDGVALSSRAPVLPSSFASSNTKKWKPYQSSSHSLDGSNEGIIAVAVSDGSADSIRMGSAVGVQKLLQDLESEGTDRVQGNVLLHSAEEEASSRAAAEGAHLSLFKWNMKTSQDEVHNKNLRKNLADALKPSSQEEGWEMGKIYASAQNLARELKETPANILTPSTFASQAQNIFSALPGSLVFARDEHWISEQKMAPFLAVTQGSDQPPRFVEIHYNGRPTSSNEEENVDVAFVGKGVTFDTGGISIKPSGDMKLMRGDMGGAAAVLASTWAIASLKLPVNVRTLIPLCENMPSGKAVKPGDIITHENGKTIEVDNTDAEGRLILSSALHYALSFNPKTIIDVATLTGAQAVALGEIYSGVFSRSENLWDELSKAGQAEGDLFWRMPLSPQYLKQLQGSNADLCNIGGRNAGACTAAAFLGEFVPENKVERWAHIDIAGSMEVGGTFANKLMSRGMSGRPVRALTEWARIAHF